MGKLPVLAGRDVCAILKRHGFQEVRRRGSHVVMQLQRGDSTVTIPVPQHSELKRGTLLSIIRQSGLPKDAFE